MWCKINLDVMKSLKKLSLGVYQDNSRGASWLTEAI